METSVLACKYIPGFPNSYVNIEPGRGHKLSPRNLLIPLCETLSPNIVWCVYTSRALFANTVCKRSRIEARLV